MMMGNLNAKQARFAEEYVVDLNATEAAKRAGYSAKTAYSQGQRLLKGVEIQRRISELKDRQSERTQIDADRVIEQLGRLGFADIRKIFDQHGNLLPITELPDEIAAAVASVKVVTRPSAEVDEDGNRTVEYVHEIKLTDKVKPLELIGKHLSMWIERHEHSGKGGGPITFNIDGAVNQSED